MSEKFVENIVIQEKEDADYIKSKKCILEKIYLECSNADEIVSEINKSKDFEKLFFDYSKSLVEWPVIPIRKSNDFYIKKHTLTQRPYYHNHEFYELIYVHNGKCVQKIYGLQEEMVINKKCAYLICPGDIHALMRTRKKDIIFKVVIPREILEKKLMFYDDLGNIRGKIIHSKKLDILIDRLLAENVEMSILHSHAMESYLQLIFIELIRSVKTTNVSEIGKELDKYLENNLQKAKLNDFAKKVGYNVDYVGKLLRKDYGKSFSQILVEYRLNKAKYLLENTNYSILDICNELGYNCIAGLYRQFHKYYGMTPTEYRNMYQ